MIFLGRFLLFLISVVGGSYSMFFSYPLELRASLYRGAASLKIFSLEDMLDILLLMDSGIRFLIIGGWFDCVLMYVGVSLGFLYGWYVPLFRLRVMSK